MGVASDAVEHATIRQYCKSLRTPTIGAQFGVLAEQANREEQTYTRYLEALLAMEVEEREHRTVARRIQDARLPRMKTLEEFDFSQSRVPATRIRSLAEGGYLERAEPIVLIGECGTGKTHLATGLCVAACRQKKRARFTTAAGLINELVEAQHDNQLRRALARWFRYELIAIDEVGYVPLADLGAELLFQVISDRAERATVILTTNLPFSEWTQVFPNVRLCKALLDRITDRAHIIETGIESYRFRRTLEKRQKPRHRAGKEKPAKKTHVLRGQPTRDRRFWAILERSFFPKERKRRPVEDDAAHRSGDDHHQLNLLTEGVGQIRRSKVGHTGWTKPIVRGGSQPKKRSRQSKLGRSDGAVYIATSNLDGRARGVGPFENDDKVLRITPVTRRD